MNFQDIFEPIRKGNFGLTEEAIYRSIQLGNKMIPLYGGNQQHLTSDRYVDEKARTKTNDQITVFEGEGIIISLDGSAGNMTYKNGERFALNHHAGFFKLKNNAFTLIDMEFFSIFFQEQYKQASISDGSKTLTLDKVYSIDLDIPSYKNQQCLMAELKPLLQSRNYINNIFNKCIIVRNKALSHQYFAYQATNIPVSEVLSYLGGNSGLTEKEIYQKMGIGGEKYKVLSGSISENTSFGNVTRFNLKGRPIKIFEDKEGVLVVRKGKAGHTTFLPPAKYTLTEDAYILYLKDNCPYQVNLKWFQIQYSNIFYDYSSSSDNGTWNMTGFFDYVNVDIPIYSEQLKMIECYKDLDKIQDRLISINYKIDHLFIKIYSDVV